MRSRLRVIFKVHKLAERDAASVDKKNVKNPPKDFLFLFPLE